MKKQFLYILLLSLSGLYAQTTEKELDDIVNAEKKSATSQIALVTNPNTLNYDITYHKLEFTVDPAVYFIAGKVTTTYTALSNMSTLTFDLANALAVSSVKKNGVNLVYSQSSTNELVITLPTTQLAGTAATVEIIYSGAPPSSGFGTFNTTTHGSGTQQAPVMWTLSEPFGAMEWWPCKQDLNDKVNAIDVYITAPSQYTSVSNGIEPEAPVIAGTNKTTHFHHGYPIPAYLIAIAVTNYSVHNQVAGIAPNQYPIINYLYPESLSDNLTNLNQTPLLLNFFESIVTPYPFKLEKYGHAQFGWGGGMEHTTVSFMVNFSRGLIAHEMAHQWFGDKVTCGSWKDIWLNEGFATYFASLVIENFDGQISFIANKNAMINNITSSPGGAVYLTDAEATDVNRIFSSRLSYNKGAMVLNMLRFKMGDTNFFQGLKNYLNDTNLAYGYAVTPNLQAHLEAASGLSLTEFFNDWVYNQGYPIYAITANNIGSGQAQITLNQTQSHPSVSFFEMPVPIRLSGAAGEELDVVLENVNNGQVFLVNVPFTVTGITFNPKKDIISKNSTAVLSTDHFDWNSAVILYPNPVSSELHLGIPNVMTLNNAVIYNAIGQKIGEYQTENIPVSNLANGIYVIQILTSEGTFHKKFIKK